MGNSVGGGCRPQTMQTHANMQPQDFFLGGYCLPPVHPCFDYPTAPAPYIFTHYKMIPPPPLLIGGLHWCVRLP